MKVIVIHEKNDLRIESRDIISPSPDEVQIQVATGGVCGSDLHYYNHGGFGTVKLREPMILGHEVSGYVRGIGANVSHLNEGDLVAVSPSRPCNHCRYCMEGAHNQCLNMQFYGSAMPYPHIQGAFREVINVRGSQCIIANGLSSSEAAMAEPFAVTLHATHQVGDLLGKRVLVTGCGPIGALSIVSARLAGAAEIVVTDLAANALALAQAMGADRTINVAEDPSALNTYSDDKGYFDVHYECSGSNAALQAAITILRPGGVIVQLGLGGDMTLPMMAITAKELSLKGSFRFHREFSTAVELMQNRLVDVKPLVTHTFALEDAEQAFKVANDRSVAMKTQITFSQSSLEINS